jgi:PH (Pleckstrin Homology) domain-containing protein/PASTA domain-containing protein
MSSNAPQAQRQDDPFTPKRVHGGYRHVRRVGKGKNRHLEFRGQQQGEVVKAVIRKHKFFLIVPAIPFIASILGLIIVGFLNEANPSASSFWILLEVILGFLVIGTGVYFLYNDLALWWVETCIITNRRIMIWKGLFSPNRQEAMVDRVVQVGVDQKSLLSMLLSYGDVHLYLVGGKGAVLEKIPHPAEVRDLFNKITEGAKQSKPPKERHPEPANPDLLAVLAKLSENDPLPTLPNPDEKYAHLHRPDRIRRPLRTFGGPLHLPCNVAYTSDEDTVTYIQRARSVLIGKLILPVLIVLGLIISTIFFTSFAAYLAIGLFVMFFVIAYTILNYIDDVYILTTKRVIEIERKFLFFNEENLSVEYDKIKDIKVNVGNPIYMALDVGKVIVETPGNNPDIEMKLVDHPFSIQDMIYAVKGHKEKVDKIKNTNERKDQLNQWFSTVLATMERTIVGKGVPNLQKLDLFAAAERASALGMKVVPVGEDPSYPNIAPGLIVSQNPTPGTLVQVESNDPENRPQILVVLSRRP